MSLAEDLVTAAAEALHREHLVASEAAGLPPFLTAATLTPQARTAVAAVFGELAEQGYTYVISAQAEGPRRLAIQALASRVERGETRGTP